MKTNLSVSQRALASHLIDIAMEPMSYFGAENLPSLNPFTGEFQDGKFTEANAVAAIIYGAVHAGGTEDAMLSRVASDLSEMAKRMMAARNAIAQSHFIEGVSDQQEDKVIQFTGNN